MAVYSHVKSDTVGDFTGTVTVFNSLGSTVTAAATDLVRPSDWNSAHNFYQTISGNTVGQSTGSGTNLVYGGTNGLSLSMSTGAGANTLWFNASQTNQTVASGNIAGTGFTTTTTAGVVIVGTNDTSGLNLAVPVYITTAAQSSVSNVSAAYAATNNTGGGTATLSGGVSFSNANNVTFYTSAGNAIAASFSYTVPTVPTSYVSQVNGSSGAVSMAAGSSLSSSTNGSSITWGLASNITTALQSAGAYLTTAAQSNQVVNSVNGSTGQISFAVGSSLSSSSNGSTITWGLASNITTALQSAVAYLTTAAQSSVSNVSAAYAATNNTGGGTATLSGGVSFSNANNITFYTSAGNAIAASFSTSQSVQTQASGAIAGSGFTTTTTAGSVMVGTNNSAGLSLGVPNWLTVAAGGGGFTGGVSTGGNTLGNTGSQTGSLYFAGGNNITLSVATAAGGAQTITISGPNTAAVPTSYVSQVNGSSGAVSMAVGSSLSSSTNGSSITWGLASNITTALQSAGAYLTTAAQSSVSNVSAISAATNNTGGGTATLSGGVSFSNANSVTFYTSAGNAVVASVSFPPDINQGISNVGNTAGNTGTASSGVQVFAGSNMITASMSTAAGSSTLWFNATQSVQTQASGNIVGSGFTTTTTAGSVMVGTNNSAGLSLGVPNWLTVAAGGAFSAGASTDAAGTTGLVNAQLVLFEGNTNITLSQSVNGQSASLSIFAPSPGGGAGWTAFWFQPEVWGNTVPLTQANGSLYIRPFEIDGYLDLDRVDMYQSFNSSRSTASFSASVSAGNASSGTGSWGLSGTYLMFSRVNTNETNASYNSIISYASNTYSQSAGYSASVSWSTNVSSATASWTTSAAVGFISQIGGDGAVTTGSSGTSGSSTFSSTSNAANSFSSSYVMSFPYAHFSGMRAVYIPAGTNQSSAIPPGEYWLGVVQSTATGSTNMPSLMSVASISDAGRLFYTGSTNTYAEIGNSVLFTTGGLRANFGSANVTSATTTQLALSTFSSISSNASMWFALDGRTK